jgi:hypothetical protein
VAIYFLLRRDVDHTEMDEVFLDADQTEPIPGITSPTAAQQPPTASEQKPEDTSAQTRVEEAPTLVETRGASGEQSIAARSGDSEPGNG